jgi:hypothetical protein
MALPRKVSSSSGLRAGLVARDHPGGVAREGHQPGKADERLRAELPPDASRHAERVGVEDERRISGQGDAAGHDGQLQQLHAVALELQLFRQAPREREEQRSADVVAAALQDLARARHATDVAILLEDEHPHPAFGQQGSSGEPVVAGTDDDHLGVLHGRSYEIASDGTSKQV